MNAVEKVDRLRFLTDCNGPKSDILTTIQYFKDLIKAISIDFWDYQLPFQTVTDHFWPISLKIDRNGLIIIIKRSISQLESTTKCKKWSF